MHGMNIRNRNLCESDLDLQSQVRHWSIIINQSCFLMLPKLQLIEILILSYDYVTRRQKILLPFFHHIAFFHVVKEENTWFAWKTYLQRMFVKKQHKFTSCPLYLWPHILCSDWQLLLFCVTCFFLSFYSIECSIFTNFFLRTFISITSVPFFVFRIAYGRSFFKFSLALIFSVIAHCCISTKSESKKNLQPFYLN